VPVFFTPLHFDLCVALLKDSAVVMNIDAFCVLQPLNIRRAEHDKVRKNLKYAWAKQVNKMVSFVVWKSLLTNCLLFSLCLRSVPYVFVL